MREARTFLLDNTAYVCTIKDKKIHFVPDVHNAENLDKESALGHSWVGQISDTKRHQYTDCTFVV